MQVQRRYLPLIAAYLAKLLLRCLLSTCRWHVQGLEEFIDHAKGRSVILALWHSRLLIVAEVLYKLAPQYNYTAFISNSQDADPLAAMAASYPQGNALRVPHNNRLLALQTMIANLKALSTIMVITPDGPRGPSCKPKPGTIIAAKETKAMVIPFGWKADSYWQLSTWDKMQLPKPFAKITITFGKALVFDGNQDLDIEQQLLQQALTEACS